MNKTNNIDSILKEIVQEIHSQDDRWGDQTQLPSVDPTIVSFRDERRLAEEYEIATETRAKGLCRNAVRKGELTWGHIAVEEMCEIIGAMGDEKQRRKELIQLAAVLVQWAHKIDKDNL